MKGEFLYPWWVIKRPCGIKLAPMKGSLLMRTLIDLQKKLFPNILHSIHQRYAVLHSIKLLQPIGRRGLAENMKLTERVVRSEVTFLQEQGFIEVTAKGMFITEEGYVIIDQLAQFMRELTGLNVLEKQIKEQLQLDDVIVVPGNSDEISWVKKEMGKACVTYLKQKVSTPSTIAVTGGSTMAAVAEMMTPLETSPLVVPARGGLGEKVEHQANTIAAQMARKANGKYRLLYVPDTLSESSYQTMINEPSIIEVLRLIRGANVVIHGIGDALTMAERRKTSAEVIQKLTTEQAVSEAFGYYFNKQGEIVHTVKTIGLQLEELPESECVITIAGGESKAEAITSYFKQGKSNLLITDEAAAFKILKGISL